MATASPDRTGAEAVAGLAGAVEAAVRRVRRRSAGWWRGTTPDGARTRAEAVGALVDRLARAEQRLTGGHHGTPPRPRRDDVLADQLAVVANDLVAALREHPDAGAARRAAAACLVTAYDVDPRPLDEAAARAVLPGGAGPDLLLALRTLAGLGD
jgi:hypothetical protein